MNSNLEKQFQILGIVLGHDDTKYSDKELSSLMEETLSPNGPFTRDYLDLHGNRIRDLFLLKIANNAEN